MQHLSVDVHHAVRNPDSFALLEVLGDEADQVAEQRFGLLLRHFVVLSKLRREVLGGDGRDCGFGCHRWGPPQDGL